MNVDRINNIRSGDFQNLQNRAGGWSLPGNLPIFGLGLLLALILWRRRAGVNHA